MTDRSDIDENDLKSRLLSMRDEVVTLNEGHAGDTAPVEPDPAIGRLSRMDALQQQAMAVEAARRRDNELHRIDAALKRIDEGEFGYCLACGDEIGKKRLELDPTSTTCIKCAKAGEHHH